MNMSPRQERIRTFNHQQVRAFARQEIAKGMTAREAMRTAHARFAELQQLREQMAPPPMLDH